MRHAAILYSLSFGLRNNFLTMKANQGDESERNINQFFKIMKQCHGDIQEIICRYVYGVKNRFLSERFQRYADQYVSDYFSMD